MIDRFGAQFVVPGFVAVDLAQPVLGAVLGQPRRGIEGPDVDRVPRHVRRRVRGGDPSGSFLFRAVLGDRLTKKLILVFWGTPATRDVELDPVVRGISCSLAQGTEESWIKVGYTRNFVIKDRRAVRDGTVSLAKRTTVLTARDVDAVMRPHPLLAEALVAAGAAHCEGRRWVMPPHPPACGEVGAQLPGRAGLLTAKDVDG